MSYLDNSHLTTPGTRTYWVVGLRMTTGRNTAQPVTSPVAWHAHTPAELGRMLAALPGRPDLELIGVYHHTVIITKVAPLTPAELATLTATSGDDTVTNS